MNDCLKPVSGHVNSIETRFPSTARHFELQLGQFFGFELHLSLVDPCFFQISLFYKKSTIPAIELRLVVVIPANSIVSFIWIYKFKG
jgi:hypothetical protein